MTGIVTGIDHLVLTVRDIDAAVAFYARALGLEAVTFAGGRRALQVGSQKINLQTLGQEVRNHACIGSGDVCLLTETPLAEVIARLHVEKIAVVEGPVQKTGARGPFLSVYFNDPDGNLIEVSNYAEAP
ncbi:VOC family protein [Albimonas sp. CAU 1670]|uniref:VOC family protein n=1 Tax=Albimonas sp. CAU 1670 TaxID=3032599 RepID=UPI0023DAC545|nr:VOC family protein [Albimonas sp. CAU 1670]MDF2234561.1 VOC family protein [Albimonas sp. CAU 1670]